MKTAWTPDELNAVKLSDQASLSLSYVNIRVSVLSRTLSDTDESLGRRRRTSKWTWGSDKARRRWDCWGNTGLRECLLIRPKSFFSTHRTLRLIQHASVPSQWLYLCYIEDEPGSDTVCLFMSCSVLNGISYQIIGYGCMISLQSFLLFERIVSSFLQCETDQNKVSLINKYLPIDLEKSLNSKVKQAFIPRWQTFALVLNINLLNCIQFFRKQDFMSSFCFSR